MTCRLEPSQIIRHTIIGAELSDSFGSLRDNESRGLGAIYALYAVGLISRTEQLEARAQLRAQAKRRRDELRAGL